MAEKRKIRFRDRFENGHKMVGCEGVSLFRPNQSMTVKEIYDRYVVGAPLPPMSVRDWNSDPEDTFDVIPDFSAMDLADLKDYKDTLNERLRLCRDRIKERENAEKLAVSADNAQSESKE